jgi:two-component system sensor histidine kinase SenX3
MQVPSRKSSIIFFIALGACLVALALALNVGWAVMHWRQVAILVLGIIFFIAIIAGLILNTTFLVREIRRNEQHDSFINAVTHELKTPITSIRLYLETLKTRDVDEKTRQQFYNIMLADNDQLLHTVEQVLRAGRLAHRNTGAHEERVPLGPLVQERIEWARARYHLDDIALVYKELADDGIPALVLGDMEELRAVLTNLLDNAVKYSLQNSKVSVEAGALDSTHVVIRIHDNGIGIPADQLKRIFRRFYRVTNRESKRVKGTGLGLFIVRSIVKRHKGRVFAESPGVGMGSTFTVELPRA